MLISQAYPSKYLKSEDLGNRTVRCIMQHVEMCDVGDGEIKPVLFFQGKEKGMVLNVTNAQTISAVYGDETEDWHGQEIVLYVDKNVNFKGKRVDGLRVRPPLPKDVEQDMRNVTPQPMRQVANGVPVRMAPQHVPINVDRGEIDTADVPF